MEETQIPNHEINSVVVSNLIPPLINLKKERDSARKIFLLITLMIFTNLIQSKRLPSRIMNEKKVSAESLPLFTSILQNFYNREPA